ncbi:hypothetical protein [Sulfurimonas sp.]|uniref:hypothetical protein n=1 Tax=Sulfurimonas sp. TaxID=2022749 RepID=UPI0025D50103|nr:hypothetical protein [Sulfurimonas sp.]
MEVTTLNILSVIGTWIAAIGTVGAVITSLWLASSNNRVKLKISAETNSLLSSNESGHKEVCLIHIVNIGTRPIKINNIGWTIGKGKKKITLLQNTNGSTIDNVPKTILENEDINIDISFIGNKLNWIENMAKFAMKHDIDTLQIIATTNINKTFKAKAGKSIISSILKKKKELENK